MGTHPIFESDFDCLTDDSECDSKFDPNLYSLHFNPGTKLHATGSKIYATT